MGMSCEEQRISGKWHSHRSDYEKPQKNGKAYKRSLKLLNRMTMDISDVHELNSRIAKIVGVKLTAFADKRRFGLQSVIRAWHERLAARNV